LPASNAHTSPSTRTGVVSAVEIQSLPPTIAIFFPAGVASHDDSPGPSHTLVVSITVSPSISAPPHGPSGFATLNRAMRLPLTRSYVSANAMSLDAPGIPTTISVPASFTDARNAPPPFGRPFGA
jgi:hypothetical protein